MKRIYLTIILIVLVLSVFGCSKSEAEVTGKTTKEVNETALEETAQNSSITESTNETVEDVSGPETYTITIEKHVPTTANLDIKVGDSIEWKSKDYNFRHLIALIDKETNKVEQIKSYLVPTKDEYNLHETDSVKKTFEEPGTYIWYSVTSASRGVNSCKGTITVIE